MNHYLPPTPSITPGCLRCKPPLGRRGKIKTVGLTLAKLFVCAYAGTMVHAADLSEADYVRQLSAKAAPTRAADPDDVFANDVGVSKSLGRVRRPDTNGACLPENNARTNTKELVIVALAPTGAPQVNLILQYASGGYNLSDADKQKLNVLARALNSEALLRARFTVAGHSDATGNSVANEKLSCARALAARTHLIAQGVTAERLSAYGFGSSQQRANSAPDSPENRRVELRRADD